MRRTLPSLVLVVAGLASLPSHADVGPPAHLRISEREPGIFLTQWRVPKALPPRAVPLPQLAETCEPVGRLVADDQARAWLFTQDWQCETGLVGEVVGLRFPFADLALTTVIRVDLLSGDRFAHVASPGEGPWRIPEGTAAPDRWGDAARAVAAGVRHVFGSWAHLPFVLAVGLLGVGRRSIRVVTGFTVGQILGVLVAASLLDLAVVPAEIAVGIAAASIAREGLRPVEERRRLVTLAVVAGGAHGLAIGNMLAAGLGEGATEVVTQVLALLGIDAGHLVAVAAVAALAALSRSAGRGLAYASGAAAIALALALALAGGSAEPVKTALSVPDTQETRSGASATSTGSRRLAPATPEAPIQSYLVVEPFEVRHEVMLRPGRLRGMLALDPASRIEVADQPELVERLIAFVVDTAEVRVDGEGLEAASRRADFMKVDATGALPRSTPLPEPVGEAVVGVVVGYPTDGMPREVSLHWEPFPAATASIPATTIDPEAVGSANLTAAEPTVSWTNTLVEDPIPKVTAVEMEPLRVTVPSISLLLIGAAVVVLLAGRGRPRAEVSIATARVLVAAAVLLGPFAQITVASLAGSLAGGPSERQARRILAGLLPNIYRAIEFRDEGSIYDRLAVSVTGDTLTDVYLEQRRTLEMEERGGAQARVEAVEILDVGEIERRQPGFGTRATWTAAGTVTHFGHRHFRQNRYDARIEIVPVDGTWKIRSLEMLEQDRLK